MWQDMRENNICILVMVNLIYVLINGGYMNINTINPLVLAYIGDAIYELEIRKRLINKRCKTCVWKRRSCDRPT